MSRNYQGEVVVHFLSSDEISHLMRDERGFPLQGTVTSVCLVGIIDHKIITLSQKRGQDIPGGHLEEGETGEEALLREVYEEAHITHINNLSPPVIYMQSSYGYMLAYVGEEIIMQDFFPHDEATARDLCSIDEVIYRSDFQEITREIIVRGWEYFLDPNAQQESRDVILSLNK